MTLSLLKSTLSILSANRSCARSFFGALSCKEFEEASTLVSSPPRLLPGGQDAGRAGPVEFIKLACGRSAILSRTGPWLVPGRLGMGDRTGISFALLGLFFPGFMLEQSVPYRCLISARWPSELIAVSACRHKQALARSLRMRKLLRRRRRQAPVSNGRQQLVFVDECKTVSNSGRAGVSSFCFSRTKISCDSSGRTCTGCMSVNTFLSFKER